MLTSLTIKNLALFKDQQIEFGSGLNIILGETGAGKSLIFDALNFVLALKSDKTLLRSGENSMRVDAEFFPVSNRVHELLQQLEVEDESVVVSRIYHADGRSSFKVNGAACVQLVMKNLAAELVDTFVQHENLEILKSKNHLAFLDKLCEFNDEKKVLSDLLTEKKNLLVSIAGLGGSDEERARQRDMLTFQINEIESANLVVGEEEQIEERLKVLGSAEKIAEILGEVAGGLDGRTVLDLAVFEKQLAKLSDFSEIEQARSRIESARIELDDVSASLQETLRGCDCDPVELERLDARRDKIRSLKRKYGASVEQILTSLEVFKKEFDALCGSELELQKLNKTLAETEEKIRLVCGKIHSARQKGAEKVKSGIERELSDLGMKATRFEVQFSEKQVSNDGADEVAFIFSANKGQQLKDLAKTASGGESSRLMLAMKNMFAKPGAEKSLLFDEIDAGISGEVGNMMAKKLSSIAERDQVIAITHLPQVASCGDRFFKVEKFSDENSTFSMVKEIEGEEVTIEIARIIGGNNVSQVMIENARELLRRGQK